MKRILVLMILIGSTGIAFAQEKADKKEKKGGFQKDHLFTGGGVNLSFGSSITGVGINPVFGYSLNNVVDAGIVLNVNYTSLRYADGDKERLTVFGPGVFTRIFPVNFLFVQGQYEHNFIQGKYLYYGGGSQKAKTEANSVLVGAGYCSGREGLGTPFYYFSVLFDIGGDKMSPYVDQYNRVLPIVKAGLQIPLFQGR